MNQKAESTTTPIKAKPERWQRLKNILADALEETSFEERAAMLRRSCADDKTLLREAEKLLAHDTTAFEEFAEFAATRLTHNERDRIGERLGAYAIVRELGRGGMGAVYLAERADGQFEKRVAIKVLKRGTDSDEVLRRFRIERQILANLEHPNITRLLDAGMTSDGLPYFVMEFIEGTPITRFVERENVDLWGRLQLFLKVCAAVDLSHRHQIIHRDIKPANVLVNHDREPKLLDFGIAKLLSVDSDDGDTTIAVERRLTPMYAAPEQSEGQPATIATDVYSLGALLYELLTGRPPCSSSNGSLSQRGSAASEGIVGHALHLPHQKPKPQLPSEVVTDPNTKGQLQGQLDQIVVKAMRHDPAQRYSSVTDLSEDIERYLSRGVAHTEHAAAVSTAEIGRRNVGAGTSSRSRWYIAAMGLGAIVLAAVLLFSPRSRVPGVKRLETAASPAGANSPNAATSPSIAVLPFENLSDDKDNAYFADGVYEDILTNLSKIGDLKVISRTSVMAYRGKTSNVRQIGKALGVSTLLEGSVRRSGNRMRVNVQLINAENDRQIWAEQYDRDLKDVFVIQSEIAETIAGQLQAKLSPSEKAAIAEAPTKDLVANDLLVRARALNDMANNPGAKQYLLQGISLLEEAVRRDPKFVLAYCLMCETQLDLYWYGFDHTTARREQARSALQEAERIQPDDPEVHLQKGLFAYHGFRDYTTAHAELELARRSLPNSVGLYSLLGAVDRRQARWDDALKSYDRAIELDPRNFVVMEEAAFTYGGIGRAAEAEKLLKRAVELSPKDYFARIMVAQGPYFNHADLGPLRQQLSKFREEGAEATSNGAGAFVACALAERDRTAAEQALTYIPAEGVAHDLENFLTPRDWFVGLVARTFGDNNGARTAFAAARAIEAKIVEEQPEYAPAWSMLGLTDAGLGRKAEAISEGKRACELLPLTKDSWEGPSYIMNLAIIYSWLGEKDLALEQLAISAHNPAGISYGQLKFQPFWDSLRGDPRFEKIVASRAPKEVLQQRR